MIRNKIIILLSTLFFITCSGGSFKSGQKDGVWTNYFDNGLISNQGKYKKGIKVGSWKEYYYNGKIKLDINYDEKGTKNGLYQEFYANGKLKKNRKLC